MVKRKNRTATEGTSDLKDVQELLNARHLILRSTSSKQEVYRDLEGDAVNECSHERHPVEVED